MSGFDREQDHLQGVPSEITVMIYQSMVSHDKFVITSKDARAGMLGRVLSGPAQKGTIPTSDPMESTFSFSTLYSSAVSNRINVDVYRSTAQKYIINELQTVVINIEDLQFANARKFIKTLQKHGKLQDFLCKPDRLGRPNREEPARKIFFRHHITKKFAGDSSKVDKWSKAIEALRQGDANYYMQHHFYQSYDGQAIRQCICDLDTAGRATILRQREIIADQLRLHFSRFDEVKKQKGIAMAERSLQAQRELAAFREQAIREAEELLPREVQDETRGGFVEPDLGDHQMYGGEDYGFNGADLGDHDAGTDDGDGDVKMEVEDDESGDVDTGMTGYATFGSLWY